VSGRVAVGDGVGMAPEVGVSVQNPSNPRAGVSVSNAWAVAIRICIALSLLMLPLTTNTVGTNSIIASNTLPTIRMSRVLFFMLIFSYAAIPSPRLV
jgi:hypothetical protein